MAETVTKLKLKYGEIEFEIEGNSETVAREREEFQKSLIPAMEVFLQRRKSTTYIQESNLQEVEVISNDTKLIPCSSINNSEYENFAHLLKVKGFNADVDKVIAAVYYLSEICHKNTMTRDEIEQELKNAKLPSLTNLSSAIAVNIRKAHMEELEKIGNKRAFRILQPGIDYCENYIPKEESSKKTTKGIKHNKTKQVIDYSSLSVAVDDLHMEEKYCDITQLSKIDEQLWVLIYMYTKETEFNTFTRKELQKIMKEKFSLSLTNAQVRRFFEQAGKNVDKIQSGREDAIKLLQGGLKKAEEIINNNR